MMKIRLFVQQVTGLSTAVYNNLPLTLEVNTFSFTAGSLTTASSESGEEQLKGSVPPS